MRRVMAATRVVAASLIILVARLSRRPLVVVLLYHRIAGDEDPVRARLVPTVPQARLRSELRTLHRLFRVVDAAEVRAAATRRRRGAPIPAAVTFDDDLAEHLDHAVPALGATRTPATFFLTGAGLDDGPPFWWDALEAAWERGAPLDGLPSSLAPRPGDTLEGVAERIMWASPADRDAATERLAAVAGRHVSRGLDAAGVRRLASEHRVGFHTRRHDLLYTLDDAQLDAALYDGRDRVAEAAGREPDALAYPHGGADDRVAIAAARAGWRLAFTTEAASALLPGDALRTARIEPGDVPLDRYLWSLAGAVVRALRA